MPTPAPGTRAFGARSKLRLRALAGGYPLRGGGPGSSMYANMGTDIAQAPHTLPGTRLGRLVDRISVNLFGGGSAYDTRDPSFETQDGQRPSQVKQDEGYYERKVAEGFKED